MEEKILFESIYQLSEIYEIEVPKMVRGSRGGETLGKGTGSSLEFQDYRSYVPGDDLRYLDWRAYGRSDSLFVKLYRDEIYPRVEIFLDGSKSMNITEEKARRSWELALLLLRLGLKKFKTRLFFMEEKVNIFEDWPSAEAHQPAWSAVNFDRPPMALFPHSIRYVISDFLFPLELEVLVNQFSHKASRVNLIQILDPEEENPTEEGAFEFVDVEGGESEVLLIDSASIQRYKKRLGNLKQTLSGMARKNKGDYVQVSSSLSLAELCSSSLLAHQMILPQR